MLWGGIKYETTKNKNGSEFILIWCGSPTYRSYGGWGQGRTDYTGIFSPMLYQLSYPAISGVLDANEIFVGFEPTTDCLTDNYSTNWVKIFSIRKNCCVRLNHHQRKGVRHELPLGAVGWIRTNDLQLMRLTSYQTALPRNGCGRRIWTIDLLVMSQASYRTALFRVDAEDGFEPPTFGLWTQRAA